MLRKKPIFFNFATDLALEGFVFDSRRYFYYHSFNKEEGTWRGAVNLAQIFFLAFKIENINYHEYKEIFSVFCSRIIELYRYCVACNIHDVSEFTGYSYFIEKKGLELELFQHKKLKELFDNSDFVSTFMHICNSVQLDKNQFFDFYSVLSPVSDLMFEIYKASTEDKDYFTHIQKYLHYVKTLSEQSESKLSFEDYKVSRQRKDHFRQMFTGKIIKFSFVLSGGLMPVKDQILSIFLKGS